MNKNYFFSLFMALSAGFSLQAQFNYSDIRFWVGSGSDTSVLVVDFNDGTMNNSYAWGYLHNSTGVSGQTMLNAIAAADPFFSVNIGGGFLNDIVYKTHAGIAGNPSWWSTWSGTSATTFSMNGGISAALTNGSWFGCSYPFGVSIRIPIAALPPSSTSVINPVACDTYTSPSGKHTWSNNGTYTDTIPNSLGYDSIITINLHISKSSSSTINPIACNSYTSPSGKYTWANSGTYTDIISSSVTCDSVITINLTINSNSATINPVACNSYTSPSGKYTWANSGIYTDTIPNSLACDSVITINLTINSNSATINPVACDSYTSPSGKHTWIHSGTYTDTIPNSLACDSVITINLTINSNGSTINPVACDSYTSPSGKHTWINSGTYADTIPSSLGCDNIITINLTINSSSSATINPVVCNSYTSPSGKHTWINSGTYTDTIPNSLGCDSIIAINLTINNNSATISPVVCNSYTSPSGKHTWVNSGTYTDTIPNNSGCDSVITINLTIQTLDVSVDSSGNILTAQEQGAIYQWLDCNHNFTPIENETNAVFTASANGSYAVEITQGVCVDTSSCITINSLSATFADRANQAVAIYPNPTQNELTVFFTESPQTATISLYNSTGSIVFHSKVFHAKQITIPVEHHPSGVYILSINSEKGNTLIHRKIIKQ